MGEDSHTAAHLHGCCGLNGNISYLHQILCCNLNFSVGLKPYIQVQCDNSVNVYCAI